MTALLFTIVSHTPTWVWTLLALLVWIGVRQMQTRKVSARRLWIVPVLVGAASLWGALRGFAGAGELLTGIAWAIGAMLGFASNMPLDLPRRASANADGSFVVEGSIAPLLLFIGVFMVRYVVNVVLAIAPSLASNPQAAMIAAVAYGLPSGLLVARSRKIWSTRSSDASPLAA